MKLTYCLQKRKRPLDFAPDPTIRFEFCDHEARRYVLTIAKDTAVSNPDIARLTVLAFAFSVTAACSGSSGSAGDAGPDSGAAPTLSFSASPTTVQPGGSSTLTWTSARASACEASGAWSGNRPTSGSAEVGPIDADRVFRLSCSGSGGGVTREVTVAVSDGNGPRISLSADPEQVAVGASSTLNWSVSAADSCTATGGWSGERALSGSAGTGPLQQTTSFGLSCSGPGGNALRSVSVEVLDKTLRWRAPTQNVDGTPITDLGGYVVYWGTQSRNYTSSHRIEDPAVTEWEADIAPNTYYFALTAFDGDGNESGYSNEVRKIIP